MELSEALISQFAKEVKASTETSKPVDSGVVVEGTAKQYGDAIYVQLDGSDQLTPVISSTAGMKDGDRVTVLIKDHSAKVTGNVSSPSTGEDEFNDYKEEVADTITEVEILIADKVSTGDFDAEKGRIDDLVSDNATIKERLTATEADITDLTAETAEISGKLTAAEADIDDLTANMLTAEVADLKYATIENLNATNADVNNLETTYAQVSGKLTAAEADIDELQAKSLTVESADIRYAKIDFANIGEAAVENLFAKSGIIEDLVVSGGHVTGELVGVTIKGDLIEGGTVKADKLVVQGSDGLYYKLNVEGESVAAEQTEYNSLNGSVITAKSITAEKVNVDDLVAFNATIGGFNLTSGSLYSGVKSSLDNTTQGIYMDDQGQLAVGDGSNYLKYFKDTDGSWKLEISAESLKMSSSGTSIETTIQEIQNGLDETVVSMEEQFYKSSLPTELNGGSWSSTQPEWTGGTYIFRRTLVTYGDGHTEYTPSETGVCITGNTGDKGDPGTPGADGTSVTITSTSVTYQAGSSGTTVPTGTWASTVPSVAAGQYLWTKTVVTYSDGKSTTAYSVGRQGSDGQPGSDGTSVTVESTETTYATSTSGTTAPSSGWQSTIPIVAQGSYLWTRIVTTYSDDTTATAYSVSRQGVDGAPGSPGKDGADGRGVQSSTVAYNVHTSGTSAPTDEWSSSIPTVPAGQYLWTRIVTNYTDGTSTTAYSVARMGENGQPGSDGADGTSVTVTSTATTYNVHTSGTEVPTDAWISTIPSVPAGQYLWTRVITTYSDGKTATAYSVARQGTDGSDGTSVTITSTSVTYQASPSGTSVPSGSWSDVIPSVTAGQYLWTKTSVSYSDGTNTVSYSVGHMGENGQPGADGSDGSDGRGIESTAITYQASSSQTTTPTGSWTTTVPKLSAEKPYLWTRTVITYTDDTTTTAYSVSSTLDGVNVGGRNLFQSSFLATNYPSGTTESFSASAWVLPYAIGSTDLLSFLKPNTMYTFSYDAKLLELAEGIENLPSSESGYDPGFGFLIYSPSDPTKNISMRRTFEQPWTVQIGTEAEASYTFTTPDVLPEDYTLCVYTRLWATGNNEIYTDTIEFRDVKFELGNIATDWTPAPEDQEAYTDEVSGMVSDLDADISENIDQIVSNIGDIQDNMDIVAETVTETTTRVAELEQFAEGWSFDFTTIQETVTQLGDEFTTVTTEQLKYIKFIDGEIWLGRDPDPGEDDFKVVISNERIRFLQNNVEVAYISNNQLYITNAKVTQRLDIGNFAFFPRDNGNLTLRFTG